MSWFSDFTGINLDVPKAVQSATGSQTMGPLTGGVGKVADSATTALGMKGPDTSPEQQQLDLQKKQQQELSDFQGNEANLKNGLMGSAMQGERHRLAQGIQSAREGAQGRGLLYSGMREDAEGAQKAQTGMNLAHAKGQINSDINNTENQLRNGAINSGFDIQQYQQQMQDNIYQQAMQGYQNRVQQNSGIGSLIGTAAGLLI